MPVHGPGDDNRVPLPAGVRVAAPERWTKRAKRFAYVFYATSDTHAIAVAALAYRLRQLGVRGDVDLVLLHLPLSRFVLRPLHEMGISTRLAAPTPRYVRGSYYRDCLIKLRVLELAEYERVVFVEADSMPMKSLSPLFSMPLGGPLAAPRAYWLPQPFWTTCLFVARPSPELWERVARHIGTAEQRGFFDMDIVNEEFADEIVTLPASLFCLNSEWEDAGRAGAFGDQAATFRRVRLVHFTALGKPWSYSPAEVRRRRPAAHPAFYTLWEMWWAAREEVFRAAPRWVRARYALAKLLCREKVRRRLAGGGWLVRR